VLYSSQVSDQVSLNRHSVLASGAAAIYQAFAPADSAVGNNFALTQSHLSFLEFPEPSDEARMQHLGNHHPCL
jgi:hypothetical protein